MKVIDETSVAFLKCHALNCGSSMIPIPIVSGFSCPLFELFEYLNESAVQHAVNSFASKY